MVPGTTKYHSHHMELTVSMELNGWSFTEYRGQPTGTSSQALSEYAVAPAAWTQSPPERGLEQAGRRRAAAGPAVATPAGCGTRLLDLRAGDCVRLPVTVGEPPTLQWSAPVTVTAVLLIDTELVQVRWSPEPGQDPFAAHLLLSGPAYHAGAIRCLPATCDRPE